MSDAKSIKSVLFVCNMNQIRSPMAEFLTRDIFGYRIHAQSAGVYTGDEDGFMYSVMKERGIDVSQHVPISLNDLNDSFVDLVVTLTEQANDGTIDFFNGQAVDLEFWPIENPSIVNGNREAVLDAYRRTRNELEDRIKKRFSEV